MRKHSKAAAMRGDESYYQPSWLAALLALAVGFFLAWHGMARADDFIPAHADRAPAGARDDSAAPQGGMACMDEMDFSPEDNLPSPFDADAIAFHPAGKLARRIALEGGCGDFNPLQGT